MDAVDLRPDDPSSEKRGAKAARPVILQVLPRLEAGGIERATVDIAGAIAEAGWVALVASAGGAMVREIQRAGAEHFELPLASQNPLVMRANAGRLAKLIGARGVDVVHVRSRVPAWSARNAARRTGAAFATTFDGERGETGWLEKRSDRAMAEGDRVIAISEFVAERLVASHGVPPERLRIVPDGVDLDIFNPAAVSPERMIQLAAEWRLPDAVPVIMLPGGMTRSKDHHVLVEALARLRRRDVRCILVGADQERTRYRQEIDDHIARAGVSGMVQVVGNCRDMPAAYMLADAVVSASTKAEAFGRFAIEAQAMGRPVIATDHGGARETVLPGVSGWLVPPGDPDELAAALRQALAMSGEERELLAVRAIEHVRRRFTRQRMCADTLEVYRELLEERVAARA